MKRLLAGVGSLFSFVPRLAHILFGDFNWHPPGWARSIARHPIASSVLALCVIALGTGGWWSWEAYQHRPKPFSVSWIIGLPETPPPNDQFVAQNLTISFDRSVARLDSIGKEVKEGITLNPPINGRWTWYGGSQLVFEPVEDWPAATTYQIKLQRSLFSPHARLETLTKEFHTAPFITAISDLQFYVNPKDPDSKQITATLTFSHPVNHESLEKNLTLVMENKSPVFQNASSAHCTITYDKLDRVAYVRSSNISVPNESDFAHLNVPIAVKSATGAPLSVEATAQIMVPSVSNLFSVSSSRTVIVTGQDGEPNQALVLATSVGVKPEALAQAIHAWVLPKPKAHLNNDTDQKEDAWQSPSEITPDILKKATPIQLTLIPSQEEFPTAHSFKLKVPENAWVYLQVDAGLEALGGFKLRNQYVSLSQVPSYPREVKIMHEGALLALSGERKLSIQSRGVEGLEFRLERITPSSINHLVSQSEGSFQSPVFTNYNFDETNIAEEVIRRQDIADTDTSKSDYSAIDFSEFVQNKEENRGKLGLFILKVMAHGADDCYYKNDGTLLPKPGKDDNSNDSVDPADRGDLLTDRRLILVTDLGLLIKDNADGTHDVFVQSIKTGEPVTDAQVDVLGKNGISVVSAKTDDNGRATLPSLQDFKREKKPVAYVVRRDQDVSFLPFGREDRELNFSRFDTSGITGQAPHDLTAFVFTDRGIYRPGDEAKLGLIIKQHDWQGVLDGVPLRLDVIDPRGTVVQTRRLKLNATGFLEATFPTRETSPTGRYQVNCYLVKGGDDEDDTLLGSQTLRVAEFLPDRMKIKATLSAQSDEGWVALKGLRADVSLQNLYGTPSVGHRVKGLVTLNPSQFSFGRYPDYTFSDPYLNPNVPRKAHEEDLPEQTTNDDGKVSFDVSMSQMEPSAYRLSFLAEGFEKEGGRSVIAGAEVLVSPREWLVGVKPDGDFSYVHLNSQRTVKFLAVNSKLQQVPVEHLHLKLAERRYVSVLVQKPNGNYAYESVLKEIPVSDDELAISDKGLDWPLKTGQPGDFAARLYDDHGDLMADVRYSVAGTGNISRSLEKNAELTAKLSKPEYLPGEEIEVEITAPYTGAGLLTIERDKVYTATWFQARTTSTVQKIRLPKDFEGNGYLNIAFVRALDSKEIYMSPLSYCVLPFKVNQEGRHTRVEIGLPKVTRPGETLTMSVKASRPTQAVVYAVDEGILQVAHYTLPDPLGYFFRRQALEVGTRQTVDLILPEYSIVRELAAAGGDGDEDALAHHLNPFKRKHDAPVIYWSGIVDLGPEAKTFNYRVPDYFAGTIRVMVVTNTPDAVGSAEATTQVRGPFVISPNVPSVVAPGDTFEVTSTIANNIEGSGPNAAIKLDLQVSDALEVVQKADPAATIAEGRDASFRWTLRAKKLLGNADITISAEGGGQHSSIVSHLSVRPPVPYLTTVTSGFFRKDEQKVQLDRRLYPQNRKAIALLSPVPLGLARGLQEYLDCYPYFCTEQLVSKAFPTLVSGRAYEGLPRDEVAKRIQKILDIASTRQNDEGAFGLWMARPDLHFDLPSVHVVHFMTEAVEQGYDIPSDLLDRGLDHLQKDADGTPANFDQARHQAYAIYVLARNGKVVTNDLEHNHAWFEQNARDMWHDDVADVYEAATYALLKNQDQADALISKFHLHDERHHWPEEEIDYDDDLGRGAQYIYLLSRHFPERLKMLTPDDLNCLANPIIQEEYSTVSSAQALLAIDAYQQAMKQSFGANHLEIDQLLGGTTKKLELKGGFFPETTFDRTADSLVFRKSSSDPLVGGLYYQIIQSGFDDGDVTQPISDGIEVSREYHNKQDQVVTSATLGEEITVVLRVRSVSGQYLSNVAIEDLLPGGFEIVEESVRTGACTYGWGQIDYVDVREDRLLAFGTITPQETEIRYLIKATNRGTYTIPPAQASAMYHLKIRARGVSGTLTVAN